MLNANNKYLLVFFCVIYWQLWHCLLFEVLLSRDDLPVVYLKDKWTAEVRVSESGMAGECFGANDCRAVVSKI